MPRTLDALAAEVAGQVADLPPAERAGTIADALRELRPKADPDLIRQAANRAAGYSGPKSHPEPEGKAPRRPAAAERVRKAGRKAGRNAVRQVSGSTFGKVFRAGLYLVGLYWLLRTAGAVESVTDGARAGLAWLMDPSLTFSARKPAEPPAPEVPAAPLQPAATR